MKKTVRYMLGLVMTLAMTVPTLTSCDSDTLNEFAALTYLSWGTGEWVPVAFKAGGATTYTDWTTHLNSQTDLSAADRKRMEETKLKFSSDRTTEFFGMFDNFVKMSFSVKDDLLVYTYKDVKVLEIKVDDLNVTSDNEATGYFTFYYYDKGTVDFSYQLQMKRLKAN
ncbi:MAG: hypothetical protein IJ692_06965 [Alloprevotella sp.]|nr:hypothetical protein [Alloprevotella sp.]